MKSFLAAICIGLLFCFCQPAKAQALVPSAEIRSVKVKNNQKDSLLITVNQTVSKPIKLPFDQNSLLFSFRNVQNPAQHSFAYKLTGLDYDWIICEDCSQVQYAHLDGGDYTFQVKTLQPDAVPATFPFLIDGNIWHQWWFVPMLSLYGLAILGIGIYFFVLFRFRQKLREQKLIHKEKMASMAELTAGIAHEIQNPLNFVNNFSELSLELIDEIRSEQTNGQHQPDEELIEEILGDLGQNIQKIVQHGKRASGIVKGMLEHANNASGERQLTNLNKLADECLQLAYNGLKAKDKTFVAEYELNANPKLPPLQVAPKELGRAIQNLLNNAFYAVHERSRLAESGYRPKVIISIYQKDHRVVILIKDNGTGISDKVKPKIFQPFFTTKSTGENTGLGLSLSYDIITKGHSGTLTVQSREGEGSEFVIMLPM
ncbi:ATP-binding protein [Spirosoma sp. KNUC1025]|uniref:ATP-binding protein n=1 Tax=Spirosoma sp. KNUC1025 TaxID=2894082 RepID=UPI0038654732|nr:GHKL domain-containing protein [Spirosoma sp. KNUC1025]